MAKKRYKKKEKLSDAIKLIVIGLLLGTVFTFGAQYRSATVTREECVVVETQFVDYEYRYRRRDRKLSIECADGERYRFDAASDIIKLRDDVAAIPPQEKITLLLHPNNDRIMELATEDNVILAFEETMEDMVRDRLVFFGMGLLMYGSAVYGIYLTVKILYRRNSQSKKGKGRP